MVEAMMNNCDCVDGLCWGVGLEWVGWVEWVFLVLG